MVVLRQPRGNPSVLPIGDGDGGIRQHGRVQRRFPLPPVDSGPPRRGASVECGLPRRAGGRAPLGGGRRIASSPRTWLTTWRGRHSRSPREAGRLGRTDGIRQVDRRRTRGAAHGTGAHRCRRGHRGPNGQERAGAVGGRWRGGVPAPRVPGGAHGARRQHTSRPGRSGRGRPRPGRPRRARRCLGCLVAHQPFDFGRTACTRATTARSWEITRTRLSPLWRKTASTSTNKWQPR